MQAESVVICHLTIIIWLFVSEAEGLQMTKW